MSTETKPRPFREREVDMIRRVVQGMPSRFREFYGSDVQTLEDDTLALGKGYTIRGEIRTEVMPSILGDTLRDQPTFILEVEVMRDMGRWDPPDYDTVELGQYLCMTDALKRAYTAEIEAEIDNVVTGVLEEVNNELSYWGRETVSKSKAQWYIVLYRIESIMGPLDDPFGFRCFADDKEHAEEQCINAYPDCDVVWVSLKENYRETVKEFWNQEESHEQD